MHRRINGSIHARSTNEVYHAGRIHSAPKMLADAMAMPEQVERAIEHQRARNITLGIYEGNTTAAGMARLLDGKDVKDTVKR